METLRKTRSCRRQEDGRGRQWPWDPPLPARREPHSAARVDVGPLQGDGDAVEEDEGQDDIVKELMGNDGLTQDPEPGQGGQGTT